MKKLCFILTFLILTLSVVQAAEERISLPDDSAKLYVSLYVADMAQANDLIAKYPEIQKYKTGNHYNVYLLNDPLTKNRFTNVAIPSAYVQRGDGYVIWSCPLRRNKPTPEPAPLEPTPPDLEPEPEPAPIPEPEPNPWIYVGLAVASVAGGAGWKFIKELRAA